MNDMTSTLKRRLEQLEEDCWRTTVEAVDKYLEGRSVAYVEFFCANGYLPDKLRTEVEDMSYFVENQ